jgi:hypothetical protein
MKHLIDGCGKEREGLPRIKDIDCEECLEILHKRAAQKLILAYEFLCEVKWQRYEAAFKAVKKEIEERDNSRGSEAWKEATSVDME